MNNTLKLKKFQEIINNEKSNQVKEYLKKLNKDDLLIKFLINKKNYVKINNN